MKTKLKHCDCVTDDGVQLFLVHDMPSPDERAKLGLTFEQCRTCYVSLGMGRPFSPSMLLGAVLTGKKRKPKKGEWYVSGAIPAAYRAPQDLNSAFHIAKLVRVSYKQETLVSISATD